MANDHELETPLEGDEGYGLKPGAEGPDRTLDLLFRTRIRALLPKPPVAVERGTSVALACARMREARVGCVLVMEGKQLVGIFTERDVLYKLSDHKRDPATLAIDELMTPNPTTLRPGHRLAHALNKMTVDGCRHLPVVDETGVPIGVVSVRRIVDFIVERYPRELMTLPPDPDQEMATREGG